MKPKDQRSMLMFAIIMAFVVGAFLSGPVGAGDLEPPAEPTSGGAMYTLDDIYDRLDTNAIADEPSGGFTEPTAAPDPTGHTLDEIYELALPTRVEKTGQTTSYATGDDGNLTMGVAWPEPRFTDNGDGTVTDNLTGLIWLKNANCFGTKTWAQALSYCNALANGSCGLTDGSVAGDWRLPNVKELQSLIHYGVHDPALPNTTGMGKWLEGDLFTGVVSYKYWSSTAYAYGTGYVWFVDLNNGNVNYYHKDHHHYVWPVRGGQ